MYILSRMDDPIVVLFVSNEGSEKNRSVQRLSSTMKK